jgi:hypothetical protein
MAKLIINETDQSPEILFDDENGELTISGKSYPENVNTIFKELLDAVETYKLKPQKKTTVNFHWLYYNTATSKIIVKVLADLKAAPTELVVNWYAKKGFTMMIEKGELIKEIMDIPMEIITRE